MNWLVPLLALLLVVPGCSTQVQLSGAPVGIGPEWTEVKTSTAIEGRYERKTLVVVLESGTGMPTPNELRDRPHVVKLAGGKDVVVRAEAVTDKGTVPLQRDGDACPGYDGQCALMFSGQLPRHFLLTAVRVKSSEPVVVQRLLWLEGAPK